VPRGRAVRQAHGTNQALVTLVNTVVRLRRGGNGSLNVVNLGRHAGGAGVLDVRQ